MLKSALVFPLVSWLCSSLRLRSRTDARQTAGKAAEPAKAATAAPAPVALQQ